MRGVETTIGFKTRIDNDVGFYSFRRTKKLKGKFIYEHQDAILKRTNECNSINVDLNTFISNINI
jgi:hypothetical protein